VTNRHSCSPSVQHTFHLSCCCYLRGPSPAPNTFLLNHTMPFFLDTLDPSQTSTSARPILSLLKILLIYYNFHMYLYFSQRVIFCTSFVRQASSFLVSMITSFIPSEQQNSVAILSGYCFKNKAATSYFIYFHGIDESYKSYRVTQKQVAFATVLLQFSKGPQEIIKRHNH
jgi:hypothetical protein